jgi:hypothetical protein
MSFETCALVVRKTPDATRHKNITYTKNLRNVFLRKT